MNIPLDLVDIFNWRENEPNEKNHTKADKELEASVDTYIGAKYSVFSHMIQFGVDYHKFMDNNDTDGLIEFIHKYENDNYWRLARFANGLKMDIEAVKNTLLYPDISNGMTEGINSLIKIIKRVGGSKAKVDLLTAKIVIRHTKKAKSKTGKRKTTA